MSKNGNFLSEPEKLAFFPDEPPMEEIVDRICLAIPHLTLRNDEAITYTDGWWHFWDKKIDFLSLED